METAAQSESGGVPESGIYPFSFQGRVGTFFGIQIVNLLLTIVTLGVYYFWAKARVRTYLWSQIEFDQDRFAYHGTGKEVFLGWLKAMALFGIPFLLLQNLPALVGAPLAVQIACALLAYLLIAVFVPVASVGSRRYRMSRSSYHGIRFSFRGRWRDYARIILVCTPLLIVTLGLYTPYFDMRRQTFFLQKSWFGNHQFGFSGQGKDLLGSFLLALLLALPTLLISFVWYGCRKTVYTWNHTTFGDARFRSTMTFGGLLLLYLGNGLILICTLGLGAPWAKVRTLRYYLSHLTLEGRLDLSAIIQEAQESTAFAEEIGDFLSMDFDLG